MAIRPRIFAAIVDRAPGSLTLLVLFAAAIVFATATVHADQARQAAELSLAGPGHQSLGYDQPAAGGMNEALPIGNGRFGGLIYGGVRQERVVLNEDSLWTGSEESSDDYDQMGAYQMLGELLIDVGAQAVDAPAITCASGHTAFFPAEEVTAATDGDPKTKWCVEHHGKPVVWELRLVKPAALDRYELTSASDVPARDPSTWDLSGSDDGTSWTLLDHHQGEPPFDKRGETRALNCHNARAFSRYRLTFAPSPNVDRFQVAEIAFPQLSLHAPGAGTQVRDYRRTLDIATAIHTVSYRDGGVTFQRESFASHPDQVIVLRFSADQPRMCSGLVTLRGAQQETTQADQHGLVFTGALPNGLRYETKLVAVCEGGKSSIVHGQLQFTGCDSVRLILAAGTNYVMDYRRHYRGEDPQVDIDARLSSAAGKSYTQLKAAHIADFQSLFKRVSLYLGDSPAERLAMPMNRRKVVYAETGNDPELEALMFQYGRYLMIACSRPGGLPANLQGLWCDSNSPEWHSDYHANINIQMNYWPVEPANLAECHLPLFDLVNSQLEPWRKATAAAQEFKLPSSKASGWAVRTSHGINGDEGWNWDVTANAWYCQHYWMHYAFSNDRKWLADVAYPVMKETCEFWEPRLKKLPDGKRVVPNGWSPEHGPHEDGVSYCQQIVWDLFNNYVKASTVLGVDDDYRAKIAAARDSLLGPQIGKWGQLQEWMEDQDDPNDHHRHTSQLFGVFPGSQIDLTTAPTLAAAAKKSLLARGEAADSDVREWSFAWRSALYARLGDGANAHRMLQMLLSDRNTCANLFGLHPPMQIDGNFGIVAGMCEMLVQSQVGEISLLPALPPQWPRGRVTGLRARGGYTVDIEWKDAKVTSYRVESAAAQPVKVRCNGELRTITCEAAVSSPAVGASGK